jgi:hypothetical protein
VAKTQLGAASKWLSQHGQPELANKVEKLNTQSWATELKSHYGHFTGPEMIGKDGDHLDVMVKEGTPKNWDGPVYVVDQTKGGASGKFDEHKVVVGVRSHEDAVREYQQNYDPGHQGNLSGVAEFKNWHQWRKRGENNRQQNTKRSLRFRQSRKSRKLARRKSRRFLVWDRSASRSHRKKLPNQKRRSNLLLMALSRKHYLLQKRLQRQLKALSPEQMKEFNSYNPGSMKPKSLWKTSTQKSRALSAQAISRTNPSRLSTSRGLPSKAAAA